MKYLNKTKIETCELTFNPCTGCDNKCFGGDCYAYQMMKRFGETWGYDWTPQLHEDRLDAPLYLKKPSLIFVPSMGDLFTPTLTDFEVWTVIDILGICDWHRFQVQTKFAERLPEFKYPSNIWLGVSLCYERDLHRLDYLRKTDARIKYAYCEPLLEELEPDFTDIDWVVIGPKSGVHKFQPEHTWVYDITVRAIEAGAKVFHKPNLETTRSPLRQFPDEEWFETRDMFHSSKKEKAGKLV